MINQDFFAPKRFAPFTTLLLVSILLYTPANTASAQRPNIIYIMADDLGYADLSVYGRKDYETPNIDKLAMQGMRFTNAYSAAPVCTPTRVGFMTGRYPARLQIGLLEPWIPSPRDGRIGLSPGDFSISMALRESGYETALIGKWHLGIDTIFSPGKNGFDYFYGIKTGAADYISHRGDAGLSDMYENETLISPPGYMTELLGAQATDFIKKPHSKPFFLSLQFTAPHWPWQAPGDLPLSDSLLKKPRGMAENGTTEIYAAMMKSLDQEVGKLLQAVTAAGLEKNTVIIFTSDNGGEKFSDMGPFSKNKMNVWEGGIRVPAFIRWPGQVKANTITDQQIITMDWSATILAIAGAKKNPKFPLDGIDLRPFLANNNKRTDRIFFWRLTQRTQQHAVVEGKWKYVNDRSEEYLFDLSIDPGEKNNLKALQPRKTVELKRKYDKWQESVLAPLPLQ